MSTELKGPAIGLDLGSRLGWAHLPTSGARRSGCRILKATGCANEEGERFFQFDQFLENLIRESGVPNVRPSVYYEEVEFIAKGVFQARLYFGFRARLLSICHARNIPVKGVKVSAVKQHATGRGNADKDAMMRAARAKWPEQNITDDNQADALWILDAGLSGVTSCPSKAKAHRATILNNRKLQPDLFSEN